MSAGGGVGGNSSSQEDEEAKDDANVGFVVTTTAEEEGRRRRKKRKGKDKGMSTGSDVRERGRGDGRRKGRFHVREEPDDDGNGDKSGGDVNNVYSVPSSSLVQSSLSTTSPTPSFSSSFSSTTSSSSNFTVPPTLGEIAPNFTMPSHLGEITLYDLLADSWLLFFSHPQDYTPVCASEIAALARLQDQLKKRNCNVLGLGIDSAENHKQWIREIEEIHGVEITYPVLADEEGEVARMYGMCPPSALALKDQQTSSAGNDNGTDSDSSSSYGTPRSESIGEEEGEGQGQREEEGQGEREGESKRGRKQEGKEFQAETAGSNEFSAAKQVKYTRKSRGKKDKDEKTNGKPHIREIASRVLYLIDPDRRVQMHIVYPPNVGRNFDEVVRVLDAVQLTKQHEIGTPANWKVGDDVVLLPSAHNDDFKAGFKELKPWFRTASMPSLQAHDAPSHAAPSSSSSPPLDGATTLSFKSTADQSTAADQSIGDTKLS